MRTSSTFSILFWVYSKRAKNNQAPLYARITVDKRNLNLSLKRKVDLKLWNPLKQRIRGTGEKARNFNQFLDEVYTNLFHCYQELRSTNKSITPQTIKSKYLSEDKVVEKSIRDIINYHNEIMFPKLHWNTSRLYLTSQNYILLFIKKKYKVHDFKLENLDYQFILDFENFLRKHKPRHYQKRIGNNAAMKHIQRLRRMVTLAYKLEWISQDPFRKFKQKLTPTNRTFLNSQELQLLEKLEIKSKRLNMVIDLFIFSCYTGISYIDLMLLTKESIVLGIDNNYWIVTERQKTRNAVKVPLLNKALLIIDKYRESKRSLINGTLFPKISNQKVNEYLKEIAALSGIQKNLTFHMARHTFATTVTFTNGVPIETISKMLGHRKLTTTQIYAKVIEKKVSEDMLTLRHKLEEKI